MLALALPFAFLLASPPNTGRSNPELPKERRAVLESVLIEGYVTTTQGLPEPNALVVTSAGGRALTDWSGGFELEVEVAASVKQLQVTAVSSGAVGMSGTKTVVIAGGGALRGAPGCGTGGTGGPISTGAIGISPTQLCSPEWLPTFGGLPGTDGAIDAAAVFDDGSGLALYVAGNFGMAGGTPARSIARWDGSRWAALGAGLEGGVVKALAVFDDGSGPALYAAGGFSEAGGSPANNVARWNGSDWEPLASGIGLFSNCVYALEVFDDGSGPALYAGGDFSSSGGELANGIIKWDGTSWSSVGAGFLSPDVRDLAVYDDGDGPALYAAGHFTFIWTDPPTPASGVAKWDGLRWSGVGGGVSGNPEALAVFDDGSGPALYVGGLSIGFGGANGHHIARWDGSSWSGVGTGLDDRVLTLGTFDDGSGPGLYASGFFDSAGGAAASKIARWDGSSWSALGSGVNLISNALVAYDDGSGPALYAGGGFSNAGGVEVEHVARWRATGWEAVSHGLDDLVQALAVYDDGSGPALFAAGLFDTTGDGPAQHIAKWNGSSWEALGDGLDNLVETLVVYDDGGGANLYAGGAFTHSGSLPLSRIARWDGTSWSRLGGGVNGRVHALAVFNDGSGPALYAGGQFGIADGSVPAKRLARWDGIAWSALGAGAESHVHALTTYDDGSGADLYVGGAFTQIDGVSAKRVARWDGSSFSALGGGVAGTVYALAVDDSGPTRTLVAGGGFTTVDGGMHANRIARWDGASWSALGQGVDGVVRTITTFDDGHGLALFAGGEFLSAGAMAVNRIARWDGSAWSSLGSGTSAEVLASIVFDDGSGPALFVAGEFASAADSGDSFLAKWACLP